MEAVHGRGWVEAGEEYIGAVLEAQELSGL